MNRIREFVLECEKNPDLLKTEKALPADFTAIGVTAGLITKSILMGMDHALTKRDFAAMEIESLPFKAAVEYMTKRMPLSRDEYYKKDNQAKFRAFTVSRIADGAILEKVKNLLTENLKEKTGFSSFLKQTDSQILDAVGMGPGKAWYWETVYRTNVQTAYNVGRAIGFDATKPLALEFVGLEDGRQTDICRHLSEAKIVLPYGDPFWDTHTPPLHFGCRSTLRAIYDPEELPEDFAPAPEGKDFAPTKGFGEAPLLSDKWWQELPSMRAQAERFGVQNEIEEAKGKLITGGSSGGILDKSTEEQEAYAERVYTRIRRIDAKNDIKKVAKASGLPEDDIEKIRNHLFIKKHNLEKGLMRFDPSPYIAHAWEALEQGRPSELDIMLLRHEKEELTLMENLGYSYDKAHLLANIKYPWEYKVKYDWTDDKIQKTVEKLINLL